MPQRIVVVMVTTLLALVGLAGCRASTEVGTTATPVVTSTPSQPADWRVVTYDGLGEIEFGAARADLVSEHGLFEEVGDCAPQFPDYPTVSPVFDQEDRLVLLWADPPMHTAEQIGVGSLVTEVREAYPQARELPAPPGTYRFDGLLVPEGDRAYLFLHDGHEVHKLIVGYTDYVELLFHSDFGTC